MPYKSILVALCGRGDEKKVIKEAVKLAELNRAELKAIHVNEPHAGEMSMMMDNPDVKYTEDDVKNWFAGAGFKEIAESVQVLVVSNAAIQKTIIKETEEVDLLILGHRRMNLFKEHFFDSIDEGIVNHVTCPVLVVPK